MQLCLKFLLKQALVLKKKIKKKMTNRFPKTSRNVQGGIMRPPSDGGLKSFQNPLVLCCKPFGKSKKFPFKGLFPFDGFPFYDYEL